MTVIEDDDSKYSYTYDDLGRVTEIDNTGTSTGPDVVFTSTYNAGGQRTTLAAEVDATDDFLNTYAYDDLGRLTSVQQEGQTGGNSVADKEVTFTYNAAGQFSTITRYADLTETDLVATTTFTYDDAHRLTDLSHDKGATNLADYGWTFDAAGRITSVTNVDGTDDYTYDDTGQLTDVDSDYQTDESYSYDANGNRTMTGYTTGDNNQLTSDGTYDYEYDDEGNRTKKTHSTTGDYVEYTWDHRNRLTAVTFRDSSDVKTKEVTYVYDVFDRRIAKDVDDNGNGTIDRGERYVYDSAGKLDLNVGVPLDDVVLVYDRSDNLIERLLHGPSFDQPLVSEDDAGDVVWFLDDNQGTIRDVVEYDDVADSTTVLNHIKYGGFGEITSQSDANYEPRHTYTGREWDADSELFYYRARWYDPSVGKFISEDPLGFAGSDQNLVRYVHNGPANYVDPTGWQEEPNPDGSGQPQIPSIFLPPPPKQPPVARTLPMYLVVRNRGNLNAPPATTHTDLVLPKGGLVGYFGIPGPDTPDLPLAGMNHGIGYIGILNTSNADWARGPARRLRYITTPSGPEEEARDLSTIVQIQVTPAQADAMAKAVKDLNANPGTFNIAMNNCTSAASKILLAGGVINQGQVTPIPKNLADHLVKMGGKSFNGYTVIDHSVKDNKLGLKILSPDTKTTYATMPGLVPFSDKNLGY